MKLLYSLIFIVILLISVSYSQDEIKKELIEKEEYNIQKMIRTIIDTSFSQYLDRMEDILENADENERQLQQQNNENGEIDTTNKSLEELLINSLDVDKKIQKLLISLSLGGGVSASNNNNNNNNNYRKKENPNSQQSPNPNTKQEQLRLKEEELRIEQERSRAREIQLELELDKLKKEHEEKEKNKQSPAYQSPTPTQTQESFLDSNIHEEGPKEGLSDSLAEEILDFFNHLFHRKPSPKDFSDSFGNSPNTDDDSKPELIPIFDKKKIAKEL